MKQDISPNDGMNNGVFSFSITTVAEKSVYFGFSCLIDLFYNFII